MRVISRTDDEDAQDPDEDGGLHSHFVEGPAKYYIGAHFHHLILYLWGRSFYIVCLLGACQ